MFLQTGTTVYLHDPSFIRPAIFGNAVEGIFMKFETTHMPDEGETLIANFCEHSSAGRKSRVLIGYLKSNSRVTNQWLANEM